jgi:hypothetical protein
MHDLQFDIKRPFKVTDDLISGKVICDFLYVFNSKHRPNGCHFQDISYYKCPPYLLTSGQNFGIVTLTFDGQNLMGSSLVECFSQ